MKQGLDRDIQIIQKRYNGAMIVKVAAITLAFIFFALSMMLLMTGLHLAAIVYLIITLFFLMFFMHYDRKSDLYPLVLESLHRINNKGGKT